MPPGTILPPLFLLATCLKILLFPSYRSTDFDVHRNWLAITRQLPISEWYFDDVNGGTVHTLDYPPAFAFFEYLLSNNSLTDMVLPEGDRCLQLLPDSDNAPSDACVIFQRSTVVVYDVIFWGGAYWACKAFHHGKPQNYAMTAFLLVVLNPALLWLDHVHFQYNGMMIGIFLASLGCLFMGNNVTVAPTPQNSNPRQPLAYDLYHLCGAALYALLLNLKHLYLPLAPIYFCYLLQRYCLTPTILSGKARKQFLVDKFLLLAIVTGSCLVLPWLPFVVAKDDPKGMILQILNRLFPFGRGLVHDYWAGNIWALFSLLDRVWKLVAGKILNMEGANLPEPSPTVCAFLLLVSILPGLWVASIRKSNKKLVESIVYVSFCAFMLAYHVHEKAILTALIPLTLLVEPGADHHNLLFWNVCLFGLLGLLPLLFRPTELTLKLSSYAAYMGLVSHLLQTPPQWTKQMQHASLGIVGLVVGILDILPIQGRWEFFPLMVTSIACALGLLGCWGFTTWLLIDASTTAKTNDTREKQRTERT